MQQEEFFSDNKENNPLTSNKFPTSRPYSDINDVPVGQKSAFFIEEYAKDGPQPNNFKEEPVEQASECALPLKERLKSKLWKTRQQALTELISIFEAPGTEISFFQEYLEDFPRLASDSNLLAQEKSLEAFYLLLTKTGKKCLQQGFDCKNFARTIVEKGYVTGKPGLKQGTAGIICFFFEKVEAQMVLETLLELLTHKNQKVIVASIELLMRLLGDYGMKKMKFLKDFFPEMEKLANNSSSILRNAALDFYKEAYKWLGGDIMVLMSGVKKSLQQEVEKFIESWPKDTIMKPKVSAIDEESGDSSTNSNKTSENDMDMYDLLEGVDVFTKFNENWCEKVLAQDKWSDKKAMLEEMIAACGVPKVQTANFFPITSLIKKILNDNNVNVMCCGLKLCGLLAKTLRKSFQASAKLLFPLVISRFKEKKAFIIEETHKTLEFFFYSLAGLDDVFEDLKEVLQEKVVPLKQNALIWLDKFLEKMLKNPQKSLNCVKSLAPTLKQLLDDSSAEIRDQVSKTLGKIKGKFGKDFIAGFFSDIIPSKLQKIEDAESKFMGKQAKSQEVCEKIAGDTNKKDNVQKKNKGKNAENGKNASKNESLEEERWNSINSLGKNLINTVNVESFSAIFQENGLDFVLKAFDAGKASWNVKTEVLKELSEKHKEKFEKSDSLCENMAVFLRYFMRDWKENNPNLVKECYNLWFSWSSFLTKGLFSVISGFLFEKLQEGAKYTELSQEFLIECLKVLPAKTIIEELLARVNENIQNFQRDIKKINAKTVNELVVLLNKLIDLVSLQNTPYKEMIDLCKFLITSANPSIKQSASSLLKKIFAFMGPALNLFLKDVSPAYFKTLQSEFNRVKILEENDKKPKIAVIQGAGKKDNDFLENLPKVDISNEVNKHLKKLSDPDWKIQKEAIEDIDKILTTNPRISQENLNDFTASLKSGLKDKKNKSLLRLYINLVGKFAESSSKDFFIHAKVLIQHLISSLSDKQALVRCDVVNSLHKFEKTLGQDFILNHIAVFLLSHENRDCQSIELKQELLNWLLKNSQLLMKFPNLKGLIPVFLSMLLDKNKDIRALTDQLAEKLVNTHGLAVFSEAFKGFRPAVGQQLKQILEKYAINSGNNPLENFQNKTPEVQKNIASFAEKVEESQAFCLKKRGKEERSMEERGNPWPLDSLNDDLIEKLKEDLSDSLGKEAAKLLFSFDLKRNQEALNNLTYKVTAEELLKNSDLLLKWSLFRVMNHINEGFLEQLLLFLQYLMKIIANSQAKLNENETRLLEHCLQMIRESPYSNRLAGLLEVLAKESTNPRLPEKNGKSNGINSSILQEYNGKNTWINEEKPKKIEEFSNKTLDRTRNSLAISSISLENVNNSCMFQETPSPMKPQKFGKRMVLQNNLLALNLKSIPGKIDALLNIYNFISEESNETQAIVQEDATNIALTISNLFRPQAENETNEPYQFLNYLVKISLKIFGNKLLLDHIEYPVLMDLVENVLQRLLLEDAHKQPENSRNTSFSEIINDSNDLPIKNLNSLMLKILETCSPNVIFQILFDLLLKYRKDCLFSKFIALVIKCILKLTKVMEHLLPNLDVGQLFVKFHLYVSEFFSENNKNSEDLGVKTIKTIINEIIKIKGASVLDHYHMIASHPSPDQYIFRWIELMLSHQYGQKNSVSKEKKTIVANFSTANQTSKKEELLKIVGKIKGHENFETFEAAVAELHGFLLRDSDGNSFSNISGFFDEETIAKIQCVLDNLNKSIKS